MPFTVPFSSHPTRSSAPNRAQSSVSGERHSRWCTPYQSPNRICSSWNSVRPSRSFHTFTDLRETKKTNHIPQRPFCTTSWTRNTSPQRRRRTPTRSSSPSSPPWPRNTASTSCRTAARAKSRSSSTTCRGRTRRSCGARAHGRSGTIAAWSCIACRTRIGWMPSGRLVSAPRSFLYATLVILFFLTARNHALCGVQRCYGSVRLLRVSNLASPTQHSRTVLYTSPQAPPAPKNLQSSTFTTNWFTSVGG